MRYAPKTSTGRMTRLIRASSGEKTNITPSEATISTRLLVSVGSTRSTVSTRLMSELARDTIWPVAIPLCACRSSRCSSPWMAPRSPNETSSMTLEEWNRRVRAAAKPTTPSTKRSSSHGASGALAARITSSTTCRSTTGTRVLTPAQISPATNVRTRLPRCSSTKGSIRRTQPPRTREVPSRSAIREPFHQAGGEPEQLTLGRRQPFGHRLGEPRLASVRVLVDHGRPLVCDVDPHLTPVGVVRTAHDQAVVLQPGQHPRQRLRLQALGGRHRGGGHRAVQRQQGEEAAPAAAQAVADALGAQPAAQLGHPLPQHAGGRPRLVVVHTLSEAYYSLAGKCLVVLNSD